MFKLPFWAKVSSRNLLAPPLNDVKGPRKKLCPHAMQYLEVLGLRLSLQLSVAAFVISIASYV